MQLDREVKAITNNRLMVANTASKELVPIVVDPPVLSSAFAAYNNIFLEQHHLPPLEPAEHCTQGYTIGIHINRPVTLEWRLAGGRFQSSTLRPGCVSITPPDVPNQWRWDEEINVLIISLAPQLMVRYVEELTYPDRIEIVPQRAIEDIQIYYIGLALKAELEAGYLGGRLYGDSLATALSIHLLRRYNTFPQTPRKIAGGLSSSQLHRVLEYIYDNLNQDLTLIELAKTAGISPSYFRYLFKQSTGFPPHQYVIRCRVERARQLLLKGQMSIHEVAAQVGFFDQSHLTRHMRRLLGITPKDIRQK